jgi:hypothetical protein
MRNQPMKLFCGCILSSLLAVLVWGQDQTTKPSPAPPVRESSPQTKSLAQTTSNSKDGTDSGGKEQTNGTSKDRLFFTLPNFLTIENAGNVPPLTASQKFSVTTRSTFDPVTLAWYGALAGIGQAENSEPTYGQGMAGYAQRYALRFADGTIENYMTKAVLPSLLHQDPRYFQSGKGRFWHRVAYAIGQIVVTRSDSGQMQFNFSEIVGSAAAAGVSTYGYHPADEKNVLNATSVWGTQVAYDALSDVLKEFWPDIRRRLHRGGQVH